MEVSQQTSQNFRGSEERRLIITTHVVPAQSFQFFTQSGGFHAGSDPAAFYAKCPAPVTRGVSLTLVPQCWVWLEAGS